MIKLIDDTRIEYKDKSGTYYREFKSESEATEVLDDINKTLRGGRNMRVVSLLLRKGFSVERPY